MESGVTEIYRLFRGEGIDFTNLGVFDVNAGELLDSAQLAEGVFDGLLSNVSVRSYGDDSGEGTHYHLLAAINRDRAFRQKIDKCENQDGKNSYSAQTLSIHTIALETFLRKGYCSIISDF